MAPKKQGQIKRKAPREPFEEICYARNCLKDVIVRVDLASPIESLAKELPKEIAKVALLNFPIEEPKPVVAQEMRVVGKEIQTTMKELTEWNFHGVQRDKRLVIAPKTFFISYTRYSDYEVLRGELEKISSAFFSRFEDAQASRLGLRYVNELKMPGDNVLDWHDHVDASLLGMLSYRVEEAEPSRIFTTFDHVYVDEGFNMRFQFGLHNPDYPAPIRRRLFVLDFDAYCQGPLDAEDIPGALDKYHKAIQSLFERSITDKMREVLNEG